MTRNNRQRRHEAGLHTNSDENRSLDAAVLQGQEMSMRMKENQKQNHNTKKEALGPNTER